MKTMKKTMILAALILSCSMIGAQPLTGEQFMERASSLSNRVNEADDRKDYSAMLEATQEIAALYGRLGEDDRKVFASLPQQIDYALTVAYAQLGRTDEALAAFERVLDSGYTSYNKADSEPGLAPLRENPAFRALMERIREYDLVAPLQEAKAYRVDVPRPEFTYQTPDAEGLRALRAEFKLDSVAGAGDEITQIKNLMAWVNRTVRHDGSHSPNVDKNASSLIAYSRETGRAINCRMIALILNECYLAMGFPSRLVSCLPKDNSTNESHAINVVYSRTLDKWLWMDATFNACMMDEAGNLLSIEEVRQRVIDEKPLFINEEASRNGSPQTKAGYFEGFMLPYLYWFESPAVSAYDMETRRGKASVRLCPPGFQNTYYLENAYATTDPAYFWQKPE
jgi:transglutaminase-like putative cysteine protease